MLFLRLLNRSLFLTEQKSQVHLASHCTLMLLLLLKDSKFEDVQIFTGRYGLGSKDTTPAQIVAVYDNTEKDEIHNRYRR